MGKLKISVVVTVLNEEESVASLLNSLLFQSRKPNEIVVVDAGSRDKTLEIIKHFQKKERRLKLLKAKGGRAEGRNLGVEVAKNEIIAMTDAGCVADKNWMERLTRPFEEARVDVVAGLYDMVALDAKEKAASFFLGTRPQDFGPEFLPSTRSMAFTKEIWSRVGGFPEKLKDTAEDTLFNVRAIKAGARFARVKDARVEWRVPISTKEFYEKIKKYAKGDIATGVWVHPTKKYASHNIKASLVVLRYLLGLILLVYGVFVSSTLLILLIIGLLVYLAWAYRKVYLAFNDPKTAFWGVLYQFTTDVAIISAFLSFLRFRVK